MTQTRRVKITSPQTRVALARRSRVERGVLPLPGPADPERALQVFLAQRRLAVRTVALLGLVLFGTSGVIAAAPALDRVAVAGVPVSWLVLTTATYPVLLALAVAHVREAERIDAAPGGPQGPARPGGWPHGRFRGGIGGWFTARSGRR